MGAGVGAGMEILDGLLVQIVQKEEGVTEKSESDGSAAMTAWNRIELISNALT